MSDQPRDTSPDMEAQRARATQKPTLYLAGPREGGPTLADILALFRALTGREPDAADMAAVRADMAAFHATRPQAPE